ncbi:MAG: hypothetical protein GF387_00125 [Candidatus Portnoybacteria bacterium]|nr:hypothetical protein [Candidatus Portnoybacteria bacterium]
MFDNNLYNLMLQLTQEHKSLWRIKRFYKQDSQDCKECQDFWEKLEKDKEEHIEELKKLIKNHLE